MRKLRLLFYLALLLYLFVGMRFHVSIKAAKGAVRELTKSPPGELAPKVRVNYIAPSLTATPLAEKLFNTPLKLKESLNLTRYNGSATSYGA